MNKLYTKTTQKLVKVVHVVLSILDLHSPDKVWNSSELQTVLLLYKWTLMSIPETVVIKDLIQNDIKILLDIHNE